MNEKLKLQELWNYLEVQDDESLIVQSYNSEKCSDEYYVVKSENNQLKITIVESKSELDFNRPFVMVQQMDSDGRHIIPSVGQIKNDELIDY